MVILEDLLTVDGPVGDHPDVVFIMHPVGDDVGAFDDGIFIAIAANGNGLFRSAACRQDYLFTVGAAADKDGISGYHLVYRILDALEGFVHHAGVAIGSIRGDIIKVGPGRQFKAEEFL